MIPAIILQSINFQLQAFVQAQNIMKPIGIANIITLIICISISNWLTFDLKVGVLLFPICKIIMEVMNFLAILVCLYYTAPGSVKLVGMKDINKGLGKFLTQGFKFILGLYAQFLGFEFNTYLAGLTHDQAQISAFVSWVNFSGILFTFGLGFGNITRTRVSNYMGSNEPVRCLNAARFYTFAAFCVGVICLLMIVTHRYFIANIYSPLMIIQDILADTMIYYSFGSVFELVLGSQNTLMRLAGRALTIVYVNLALFFVLLGFLSIVFGFILGMHVPGMVLAFVIVTFSINCTFFYILNFQTDWKKCIDTHKANELKEEEEAMLEVGKKQIDHGSELKNLT